MLKLNVIYENQSKIIICNRFKRMTIEYPIEKCKFSILDYNNEYNFKEKSLNRISGIYRISRNDKSYIGQSIDILSRWDGHFKQIKQIDKNSSSEFYRTLRKHWNEFVFEIIELVDDKSKLNEQEIYWISYFNSYNNGFNQTLGGDGVGHDFRGEKHHNYKISEKIVRQIRYRYNDKKETAREVYKDYKDFICESTFKKIWNFTTWKHIHPEFDTVENSEWHTRHMNFSGNANPRKILSNKERNQIRELLKEFSGEEIYENYFNDYLKSNFMRQLNEIKQYKTNEEIDFVHNKKTTNNFLKRRNLTENDIKQIRQAKIDGQQRSNVFETFKNKMSYSVFLRIWNGKTAKTIQI